MLCYLCSVERALSRSTTGGALLGGHGGAYACMACTTRHSSNVLSQNDVGPSTGRTDWGVVIDVTLCTLVAQSLYVGLRPVVTANTQQHCPKHDPVVRAPDCDS